MRTNKLLLILLTTVGLFTAGCKSDSGGTEATSSDPYIGSYFTSATDGAGNLYHTSAEVKAGNNITFVEMYSPRSNPSRFYYRKKVGFYSKTNNDLMISWTYETCDPMLNQTIQVTSTDPSDRIFVTIRPNTFQMLNAAKWAPTIDFVNSNFIITEDINCNLIPD